MHRKAEHQRQGLHPSLFAPGLGALLCLVVVEGHAGSLSDSIYTSKHLITLGAAQQKADATIAATPTGSEPFEISLKDLAIDNQDESFYLEYTYRFKPKWALVAGTYQFGGSGNRTTERTFEYGGVEFTAGSNIRGSLEVDAYIVDVLYQAYSNDRFEVMVGGGLHALDLGADIRGQVLFNDLEGDFRNAGSTLLAPRPQPAPDVPVEPYRQHRPARECGMALGKRRRLRRQFYLCAPARLLPVR